MYRSEVAQKIKMSPDSKFMINKARVKRTKQVVIMKASIVAQEGRFQPNKTQKVANVNKSLTDAISLVSKIAKKPGPVLCLKENAVKAKKPKQP